MTELLKEILLALTLLAKKCHRLTLIEKCNEFLKTWVVDNNEMVKSVLRGLVPMMEIHHPNRTTDVRLQKTLEYNLTNIDYSEDLVRDIDIFYIQAHNDEPNVKRIKDIMKLIVPSVNV